MQEFQLIAKTFQGLEEVLAQELTELGFNEVQMGKRMVSFVGDKEAMYRANFCLRTAVRVLKPFHTFAARTPDEVYDAVKTLDWSLYIQPGQTFSIDATVYSSEFRNSRFVTYRVKDAIVDHFMEKEGRRPNISLTNPDIRINLHIAERDCTLSLDSSGESLHLRGYRVATVEAPINEVMAAALVKLSGWQADCDLIDPFCGSGTIAIEAALIARNIYPGVFRKKFGFENWPDFDPDLLARIYEDDSQERDFPHHIYAYDLNRNAVLGAEENAKNAGVADCITCKQMNFQDFSKPKEKALIITNPPYGERLHGDTLALYELIGTKLKHEFTGGDAWLISSREELFDAIGMRPSMRYLLQNGALDCEFRKYQVFDGSMKDFKTAGFTIKTDTERRRMTEQSRRFSRQNDFKKETRFPDAPNPYENETEEERAERRRFEILRKHHENFNGQRPGSTAKPARYGRPGKPGFPGKAGFSGKPGYSGKPGKPGPSKSGPSFRTILTLILFSLCSLMATAQTKIPTLDDLLWNGKGYKALQPEKFTTAFWGDRLLRITDEAVIPLRDAKGKAKTAAPLFSRESVDVLLPDTLGKVTDFDKVAFPDDVQPLALIRTTKGRVLYNWKSKALVWSQPLDRSETQANDFSYAARATAYVKDWNLYIADAEGQHHQLTADGTRELQYGLAVHRDEWGIDKGTFWSPKGSRLAFYRMDQSMVTDFPLVDIDHRIAEPAPEKYPMAGMTSHKVQVGIYDTATQRTVYLQTGDPTDRYFTNISWSPDEKTVYLIELPRSQDRYDLVSYDAATGRRLKTLYTETNARYVHPMHPLTFLPWDSSKFILQSERDGYNHLYLYDTDGHLISQLTSGPYVVTSLVGFCPKQESVIVVSTKGGDLRHNIYNVRVKDGETTLLGNPTGSHRPLLAHSGQWLVDQWTAPENFRQYDLVNTADGRSSMLRSDESPWKEYRMPTVNHGTLKAADDTTTLHWRMVLPVGFDPAKKYPTVVYVYGGPGLRNVEETWNYAARPWEYHMAHRGYIIFVLDNRGSKDRGFAFESCTFRHLGDLEMADQMRGVDYLKSLPYVDPDRIGVHGWSYGGFMTTNLMLTHPDVFKVGVAGGPVIDWKYYEVMYGERYMDTPEENPEGYASSSLLGKAGNLKGRLQIIVGYNDPTCVLQHSLSFLRACEDAGTQPDYFVYPGQGHNMSGADQIHLHERITRYFDDYLK